MPSLRTGLLLLLFLLVASFSIPSNQEADIKSANPGETETDPSGKQLAHQYCGNCHLFPEPELLDKKTWVTGVLPNMAMRLGLKLPGQDTLKPLAPEEEKAISQLHVYPGTSALTLEDWEKIVRYYEQTAPEIPLPQKPHAPVTNELTLFATKEVTIGDKPVPQTTLLKFDA
ncbi:hypothetical protein [Spirosoma pulveris]